MSMASPSRELTPPLTENILDDEGKTAMQQEFSGPTGGADTRKNTSSKDISCQVPGCQASLGAAKAYHRRYRICAHHAGLPDMQLSGETVRFCQQCGRFQPLGDFDGAKRSCRRKLEMHNAQRKRARVRQKRLHHTPSPQSDYDINNAYCGYTVPQRQVPQSALTDSELYSSIMPSMGPCHLPLLPGSMSAPVPRRSEDSSGTHLCGVQDNYPDAMDIDTLLQSLNAEWGSYKSANTVQKTMPVVLSTNNLAGTAATAAGAAQSAGQDADRLAMESARAAEARRRLNAFKPSPFLYGGLNIVPKRSTILIEKQGTTTTTTTTTGDDIGGNATPNVSLTADELNEASFRLFNSPPGLLPPSILNTLVSTLVVQKRQSSAPLPAQMSTHSGLLDSYANPPTHNFLLDP